MAIETLAFFVGHLGHMPFLEQAICRKYGRASKGLERLESSLVLTPSDEGFNEFQEIFLTLLARQNLTEVVRGLSVRKFQREGARLAFSRKRAKEVVPIKVSLSNGQEITWNTEDLITNIEKLRTRNMFVMSIVIFLFGVTMQIVGLIIEITKKLNDSGV